MLSTLGLLGLGMAGGLGLAWWRSRSRSRVDWEGLADQGLLRLDAHGRVCELGSAATQMLGFERRCDQAHLEDLPIAGLCEWFSELDVDRTSGRSVAVAEREFELESFHWTEGRLVSGKQMLRCRLQPKRAHGSVLPAALGLSVVSRESHETSKRGEVDEENRVLLARPEDASLPENTVEKTMSKHGEDQGRLDGMKILLAEDFKSSQLLLQFFLEQEGADITMVGNGQDAMEEARSGKYDLVFLDAELPDLDGAAASRALRNEGFEGRIVVLTPHIDPSVIESYHLAGCTDHLEKPFKSRELRDLAQNIAERAGANLEIPEKSDHRFDDPEFLELINEFVASLDERLHELESALESSDWKKIEFESHRLAGTAGIYGMPELSVLGAEIEELVLSEPGSNSLTHKISDLRTAIHGVSGHQLIQDPRE